MTTINTDSPLHVVGRILTALSLLASLTTIAFGAIQRPIHDGKTIMFGNLHAHSKLSDDVINAGDDMLPIVAFRYAHQHGLDFLAISDHHKADDSPHSLGMQPVARTVTAQRKCLIFATSQLLGGHYSEEEKNEGFVDILLKQ